MSNSRPPETQHGENRPEAELRVRSVCIFCGSSEGLSAEYATAATMLVSALVERGARIVYGGGRTAANPAILEFMPTRQMLHAWRIEFIHPHTLAPLALEAPVPSDMKEILEALRHQS